MRWLALVSLLACACACPSKQSAGASTSGSGAPTGSGGVASASGCDGIRAKVEGLYRAEAQAKEPKRVDEAVADNTAMVMGDCARNPAAITACVQAAATLKDVEACLPQPDDEGTEGDALAR